MLLLLLLLVLQALRALGVVTAFDPNKASFNRLSSESLYVTDVVQSVSAVLPTHLQ